MLIPIDNMRGSSHMVFPNYMVRHLSLLEGHERQKVLYMGMVQNGIHKYSTLITSLCSGVRCMITKSGHGYISKTLGASFLLFDDGNFY